MLCDICGKNQATVHLTEIIDEQMSELHLCEQCARKKSDQMEQQFGLADLLAGLADFGKPDDTAEKVEIKCSNCGLNYDDFKKIGRLGCSECYNTFKKYLLPLLRKIHGSTQHAGKSPYKTAVKAVVVKETIKEKKKTAAVDVNKLRYDLQMAIEKEEFEEAARLRDKIRDLEKKEKEK